MTRKKRSPEKTERRAKIRELLQLANVSSMDDIQNLFKDTIAEFMENDLEAELDGELGYSRYDYRNKETDNSRNGHSSKTLRTSFGDVEVLVPRYTGRVSLNQGSESPYGRSESGLHRSR